MLRLGECSFLWRGQKLSRINQRTTTTVDRKKTAANKKHSHSRGIRRPIVTKLEEDPKNLRAVVSRQLIELLDDVQRLPLDRPRHLASRNQAFAWEGRPGTLSLGPSPFPPNCVGERGKGVGNRLDCAWSMECKTFKLLVSILKRRYYEYY